MTLSTLKKLNNLSLVLILILIYACNAGTIQNTATPLTETREVEITNLRFAGISAANGISHDKIEVFFSPALGGSGDYIYLISAGDSPTAVSVPQENLFEDYLGRLKFTLTDLPRNRDLLIRVDVRDEVSGETLTSDVRELASTFGHDVAFFNGVSSVSNLSGLDGLDSLRVRWGHALVDPDITGADSDPVRYEITLADSSRLLPSDMNNPNLGIAEGRYFLSVDYDIDVTETVVRGLPIGTDFFVQVRAIHRQWQEVPGRPDLRSELNTDYILRSTLDDPAISPDPDAWRLRRTTGLASISTMSVSWDEVEGVFDHFRVYFAPDGVPLNPSPATTRCSSTSSETAASSGIFCKRVPFDRLSTIVTGLTQSTVYNFQLYICLDASCTSSFAYNTMQENTIPTVSLAAGVTAIRSASSIDELGSFFLQIPVPNFEVGFFDGFIIQYTDDEVSFSNPIEVNENSSPAIAYIDYLEPANATFGVEVTGIDYTSSASYCFRAFPFIYDASGSIRQFTLPAAAEGWICRAPSIATPTEADFPGIQTAFSVANFQIDLLWNRPSAGIFSHYEVFQGTDPINGAGSGFDFSWGDATAPNASDLGYTRYFFGRGGSVATQSFRLTNLDPYIDSGLAAGTNPGQLDHINNKKAYFVGIRTYFFRNTILRSIENDKIWRCTLRTPSSSGICTDLSD